MYLKSATVVVYPTVNSRDYGKINSETNLANIVRRITDRNFTIGKDSLKIISNTNTSVTISKGSANIAGYDISILENFEVSGVFNSSRSYEIIMYLNKDYSGVLYGDVEDSTGVSYYEGLNVNFRDPEDPRDPLKDQEGLVIGKVDIDNTGNIENTTNNDNSNLSINGDTIIINDMTLIEYLENAIYVDDGCID